MVPLQFGNDKDIEIVRESDALFKLLRNESELRKNISKGVIESKYNEYKIRYKYFTDEIKQLKKSESASALFQISQAKKFREELKNNFVGLVVREIITKKYGLEIVITPAYKS